MLDCVENLIHRCTIQHRTALSFPFYVVVGVVVSQAHVTVTLPKAGSASFLKALGLKSMSLGAQPVPD